jgi:hypothetical protein
MSSRRLLSTGAIQVLLLLISVSADGEEQISRITGVIARLKAGGFDTSAAEELRATMTKTLNLMRGHRAMTGSW